MTNTLTTAAIFAAALAAAGPAAAQAPARQPARAAPAAQAQPSAPSPIFPCRTAEEVCYLGVVVNSQVLVLYTNAPSPSGLDKPIDVTAGENAKVDLAPNNGRVVMLTGTLDPKAGLTKAELVEVASPLASLAIKGQLLAGADEAGGAPKGAAPRRR